MRLNFNCDIRNEFTIVRENIDTHEKQEYKAYNILLNQIYSRLCNFQPYFTHIHFGTGTGTFDDPARTSLYTYLGNRSAVTEFQTASYPTSQWRRKITLLPEEYVGSEITEIGVAYGTSSSNLVTQRLKTQRETDNFGTERIMKLLQSTQIFISPFTALIMGCVSMAMAYEAFFRRNNGSI